MRRSELDGHCQRSRELNCPYATHETSGEQPSCPKCFCAEMSLHTLAIEAAETACRELPQKAELETAVGGSSAWVNRSKRSTSRATRALPA